MGEITARVNSADTHPGGALLLSMANSHKRTIDLRDVRNTSHPHIERELGSQ
jgi:hypothetical protein